MAKQVLDRPKPVNELRPIVFDNIRYKLFVYGNLKRGLPMSGWLRNEKFLSEAITRPIYLLYNLGGAPALVENIKDGIQIHGELWEISAETLKGIDYAEREGVLYLRDEVRLMTPTIEWKDKVWAYFYLGQVHESLRCGNQWPPSNQSA